MTSGSKIGLMAVTSKVAPERRDSDASGTPLAIAVVNDHPVVVNGVARLVERYSDQVRVVEGDSDVPTITTVDVALFDTFAAEVDGGEGFVELLHNPHVRHVVVYSWYQDSDAVERALALGAAGYLSKSLDGEDLVEALVRIGNGETVVEPCPPDCQARMASWPGREQGLTPRESEMLVFIAQGLTNAEIAERCYLSINSVKSYISSAYRRIGVQRRSQAVAWALENGLSPTPQRWLHR